MRWEESAEDPVPEDHPAGLRTADQSYNHVPGPWKALKSDKSSLRMKPNTNHGLHHPSTLRAFILKCRTTLRFCIGSSCLMKGHRWRINSGCYRWIFTVDTGVLHWCCRASQMWALLCGAQCRAEFSTGSTHTHTALWHILTAPYVTAAKHCDSGKVMYFNNQTHRSWQRHASAELLLVEKKNCPKQINTGRWTIT